VANLTSAIESEIIRAVETSMERECHPAWGPALQAGDTIEDLDVRIPGERQNWVRRTVIIEQHHVDAARKRLASRTA
jgi:hypothetical protein